MYVNGNNIIYFDSFGVQHISKEIKNTITNICWIQAYSSILYGYFCIGFIDFMLKGKSFLDYANLFSPNDCESNDRIIPKHF